MLGLVTASILLLAIIVDYADHVDKIARNQPPRYVVLGYYRYFLISIGVQVAPFAVLIATMVSLGLSKNNEDTAFKASGCLSRPRPILVVTFLGAGFLFTLGEYMLPFAEQRRRAFATSFTDARAGRGAEQPRGAQLALRIRRPHLVSGGERSAGGRLNAPMVFEFNQDFEPVRRMGAKEAR